MCFKVCAIESKRNRPKISFSHPFKRACYLLGLSERTVNRYASGNDSKKDTVPALSDGPSAAKKIRGRKNVLDSFDKMTIRNTALRLMKENKTITVDSLRRALADKIDVSVSKIAIWRALHSLGFRYGRIDKKRLCLYERKDNVSTRLLRHMVSYSEPAVYQITMSNCTFSVQSLLYRRNRTVAFSF